MTPTELKQRYADLYTYMAGSKNPEYMKMFGSVMTQMMDDAIVASPAKAEEWIDRLEAIRWQQYLTPKEADAILARMDPKAPWTRDQWRQAMETFSLPLEEAPCYNRCALYVEMSKIYSDFGDTIAEMLGKPIAPTDKDIIAACYKMALKTLKDKDGVYSIRRYFSLM